jgi:predicted neutral ceramidase superfamily lipid hydrolase
MYVGDLGPVLIALVITLLCNPILTTVFISQRYFHHDSKYTRRKRLILVSVFFTSFFAQFLFRFYKHPVDGMLIYFITITTLVIWDRIAKRKRKRIG